MPKSVNQEGICNLSDIKFEQTTTTDLGNGEVKMDVYEAKLDAKVVKRILGNGNISLYESVKNNSKNEGMKKMMSWLIEDIEFTMAFNDAKVLIGIVDNTLAYVNLEIGGLGTKEYLSKCYIENVDAVKDLAVPDISQAITYEELYSDYADIAVNYDSMEDLYDSIYGEGQTLSQEELQEIIADAVKDTEEKMKSVLHIV